MHKENLRENLKKLHTELASLDNLDEELDTLLRQVAEDIEQVIGDAPVEPRSGKEQLQEMAIKFETDHPRLGTILSELADTLSKLGL